MPRRLRGHSIFVSIVIVATIATMHSAEIGKDPNTIYLQLCANCHEGGKAPRLDSGELKHGQDDASLTRSIRDGYVGTGMPAFGPTLAATDIQALVVLLHERMAKHVTPEANVPIDPA